MVTIISSTTEKIDLSEIILVILISKRVRMNINALERELKKYSNERSLVYTNKELQTALNNLAGEWTTFAGVQYRLVISVWQPSRFYRHKLHILFYLESRSILFSQEEECPSSSLEGIRADGMMDMVT